MPVIHSTIPSVNQTVVRPVIMGVIDHFQAVTGIRCARVVFPNGEFAVPPSSTTLDEKLIYSEFGDRTKIFIEAKEEIMPETLQTTAQYQNELVRFYNDTDTHCFFAPIIQQTKVTLDVKYRHEHRNAVTSWVNTIANKIKNDTMVIDSIVDFTYILPKTIVELLVEIYNRTEAIAPLGNTLPEYVRKYFTTNFTILEDMAAGHKTPAIRYIQSLVRAYMDLSAEPQKVKGEVGDTWEASISLVFFYDKPVSVYARYSPMIHSQLLPNKFQRPYTARASYRDYRTINYKSIHHLNKATGIDQLPPYGEAVEGCSEQNYDDWLPAYRQKMLFFNYRTLVVVESDGLVVDLNELGTHALTDWAKRYLKLFREDVTEFRKALIFIVLYEDGNQTEAQYLHLTDDLKLYCTGKIDPRKTYRLVLSSLKDPKDLFRDAWDKHEAIGDTLEWHPEQEQIIGGVWHAMEYEVIALKDPRQ